jgi:RNA-binding protein
MSGPIQAGSPSTVNKDEDKAGEDPNRAIELGTRHVDTAPPEGRVGLIQTAGGSLGETVPMPSLTNAQVRALKAQAQRLTATLKLGKDGLSLGFLAALNHELNQRELVKVKFDCLKDRKKELAPQLAEKSGSHFITRVGNVVVLFRPKPAEAD